MKDRAALYLIKQAEENGMDFDLYKLFFLKKLYFAHYDSKFLSEIACCLGQAWVIVGFH